MAQFDAFANPNAAQSEAFPYFVVLQSNQLSQHSTRLCMPLASLPRAPTALPRRLTQSVLVEGERLYLAAHLCAAMPARLLKEKRVSLRDEASAFRDALDAVLSGV